MNYLENLKVLLEAVEGTLPVNFSLAYFSAGNWRKEPGCGTLHCTAGLMPYIPHFVDMGVCAGPYGGAPVIVRPGKPSIDTDELLDVLFGTFKGQDDIPDTAYMCLCASAGYGNWDDELTLTYRNTNSGYMPDKELALARIRKAIAIREAEESSCSGPT